MLFEPYSGDPLHKILPLSALLRGKVGDAEGGGINCSAKTALSLVVHTLYVTFLFEAICGQLWPIADQSKVVSYDMKTSGNNCQNITN